MSTLKTVGMELIHANPYRLINSYPFIEPKLDSLVRSIEDVGFWEGVIARPNPDGKGYQIAFGHHRIEAAKRAGLNRAPIIVRDLTDEQMIQFMGRENGEDYKADFITMLNTWEGAVVFSPTVEKNVSIAKLLGWTFLHQGYEKMNKVAQACANAHSLIESGHMKIEDFSGMSVKAVSDLVAPAIREMKTAEKREKQHVDSGMKTPAEAKKVKARHVDAAVKGVKVTADSVRKGNVAPKDIQRETAANIGEKKYGPGGAPKVPADFVVSMRRTGDSLNTILNTDSHSNRLAEAMKVVQYLEDDHMKPLRQVVAELRQLSARADDLAGKINTAMFEREIALEDVKPELKMIEGGAA